MAERWTVRMTDERKRLMDQAQEIIADPADEYDDPPKSDVLDAALRHLIASKQNIEDARGDYSAETIQAIANTPALKLHYRTTVESPWRR